jgi:hypothetical protein
MSARKGRTLDRSEEMIALVNAMWPYLHGELEFDPLKPPKEISNAAVNGLRCERALDLAVNALSKQFEDAQLCDDDQRASEALVLMNALASLLNALMLGKRHPLLDYWETLKGISKKDRSAFPGSVPLGKRREQSSTALAYRKEAAVAVSAFKQANPPIAAGKAKERVAGVVRASGIFPRCSASHIHNWWNEATKTAVENTNIKVAGRGIAEAAGLDAAQIEEAFRTLLLRDRPVMTDTKRERSPK